MKHNKNSNYYINLMPPSLYGIRTIRKGDDDGGGGDGGDSDRGPLYSSHRLCFPLLM